MVDRYDMRYWGAADEYEMVESDSGTYVLYSDYAALQAERDRLRGALAYCAGSKAGGPGDLLQLAMRIHDEMREALERIASASTADHAYGLIQIARRALGRE